MPLESDDHLRLEIGHVLFLDIVGYSKLLIEDQKERLRHLTEIVLATPQVAKSTDEQLLRLPTGDGVALVFRQSAEEPARCALEIAEALRKHPELPVRMGIHSGPVSEVIDVSGRTNIAGAGINMAQRVMDCGDAGHILLSLGSRKAGFQQRGRLRIFPYKTGFGCVEPAATIAAKVKALVATRPNELLRWNEVLQRIPELSFTPPFTFREVGVDLRRSGVHLYPEAPDQPEIIGAVPT